MTKNITASAGGSAAGGGNGNGHSQFSARRPAGQPIYTADGHTAGYVSGRTFRKRVEGSRHMLKKPRPAWAMDEYVLDQLRAAGVTQLVVEDTEAALTYSASLSHFERHCWQFDYGRGVQVAMGLRFWHVEVTGSQRFARQLELWGSGDGW